MIKKAVILLAVLALIFSVSVCQAQNSPLSQTEYRSYLGANSTRGTYIPTTYAATTNGTGSDTMLVYFGTDQVPYGAYYFKFYPKDTTATVCYVPDIAYKYIDNDGKCYGDSANGWIAILASDSLKPTITAKDTIDWYKAFDYRQSNAAGIALRLTGNVAADSTDCQLKVSTSDLIDNKKSKPAQW
ncbi:MAG: hypothetical protein RDU76_06285 [Candidatus Edwardsbacteria bacterium]|nr:hypothetical protein [Candidatus Edwardsbacteria bacterium]